MHFGENQLPASFSLHDKLKPCNIFELLEIRTKISLKNCCEGIHRMANKIQCGNCGAYNEFEPSDPPVDIQCNQCGKTISEKSAQQSTLINSDAYNPPSDLQNKMTSGEVKKVWNGIIKPDMKPDMTIKEEATGSSRTTRLVVKSHAVTSGSVDAKSSSDYELLEVLGEGGMGVVYSAHQTSIGRTIAVKMIRPEAAKDDLKSSSFLSEAAITGELEHPNIVPIYELGSNDEGRLFYAMKKIKGVRWSNVLQQKSQAENLDILMRVADATAFAHSKGIIHRDIKPSNVMLGDFGEVLLIDWGLAVSMSKDGEFTAHENFARGGTPAYMAPEMAMGLKRRIGFHSDIYLLGAILYHIVTGAPPHIGNDTLSCVMAAADNKIPNPTQSGELIDIALKAMSIEPRDRYLSIKDFQNAIRDYQAHSESIVLSTRGTEALSEAQKTGDYQSYRRALAVFEEALTFWSENDSAVAGVKNTRLAYATCAFEKDDFELAASLLWQDEPAHVELAQKVASAQSKRESRQKLLKKLVYTSATLAAVVFVIITFGFFRIRIEQGKTKTALMNEQTARSVAEEEKHKAIASEKEATAQREQAEIERKRAITEKDRATAAEVEAKKQRDISERENYFNVISLAENKIDNEFTEQAEALLWSTPKKFRNWEWGRLISLYPTDILTLTGHTTWIDTAVFSLDGKRIVTASRDNTAKIWDAKTGKELTTLKGHIWPLTSAVFSSDGKQVLTASRDRTAKIWDVQTGREIITLEGHPHWVVAAVFSPDGKRVLTASYDKTAKIWDAQTGKELTTLKGHAGNVNSAAFSPDGKHIVTASHDKTAKIWDAQTGRGLITLKGHSGSVSTAVFSPDGKQLMTSSLSLNGDVKIWDVQTGQEIMTLEGRFAVFSPDGKRIVTADIRGKNANVRSNLLSRSAGDIRGRSPLAMIWDAQTGREIATLKGHHSTVNFAAFSSDGKQFVTVADSTLKIWDTESGSEITTLKGHSDSVSSAAFSPDGKQIVTASHDDTAKVWDNVIPAASSVTGISDKMAKIADTETSLNTIKLKGHTKIVTSAVFSSDGKQVLTASNDRTAKIWDAQTGKELTTLTGQYSGLASAVFSPDSKRVITIADINTEYNNIARIWNVQTAREIMTLIIETSHFRCVTFSPDGKHIATGANDGTITIWHTRTGEKIRTFQDRARIKSVAFSPDGKRILTACRYREAKIRDVQTGKELITLKGHRGMLFSAAFSSDGRRVVTASVDRTAKIWDAQTGREIITLKGHSRAVTSAVFSPDGKRVITTSDGGTAKLWEVQAGKEIMTLKGNFATFSPDGRRIVTEGTNNTAIIWEALDWTLTRAEIEKIRLERYKQRLTLGKAKE